MVCASHEWTNTSYYEKLTNKRVSEVFVRYLEMEGVDAVFGLTGVGVPQLVADIAAAEGDPDVNLKYVQTRHDGAAAYMADGYGRVSGKIGVCIVTAGPGATNAVTGAAVALADNSALLVISGEVDEELFGRGGFQEGADAGIDMVTVFSGVTAFNARVSNSCNFQSLLTQALRTAQSGGRRSVHLSLPRDIAATEYKEVLVPHKRSNYMSVSDSGNPNRTRSAWGKLMKAERPLLFLGSGCRYVLGGDRGSEGAGRLRDFTRLVIDKHAIPVMTTPRAKGLFPESHELSLRNYGIAAGMWSQHYLQRGRSGRPYDALMVLGSSLKEWSTNEFHPGLVPEGPIVQVNVDSAVIARAFPVEDGIVADAGAVIDQLIQLGDATPPGQSCDGRREAIAELKRQASPWHEREKRESTSVPLKPQRLMADVQEVLDEPRRIGRHGANVVLDIGNNAGWAWHHLTIDPPNRIWSNTGFGCVGWGNGAVVGAKLAAPEQTAICITGDGGFLMNGAEVTTAVQHGIGCVWLVLRDNSWSQVSQAFSRDFDEPDNIDWASYFALGGTPIEQMAEGFGARVHVVRKPREAIEVLSSAIAAAGAGSRSVPQVVVAHIDPAELPPFGLQKLSDVLVDEGLARVAGAPASATRPEIPGWYPERRR